MSNLYVICPVTGIKDDNLGAFKDAKRKLEEAGHTATIPHSFISEEFSTWELAMMRSIHEFTLQMGCAGEVFPFYDGIAMLDGWEDSKGAKIEHDLAEALGIQCKPWREWLNERLPA